MGITYPLFNVTFFVLKSNDFVFCETAVAGEEETDGLDDPNDPTDEDALEDVELFALPQALKARSADPATARAALLEIGFEICFKTSCLS